MKIKLISAGLIVAAISLTACRKGEDDPFFTLATRKNRICGEWQMTSYEKMRISRYGTDTSSMLITNGTAEQLTETFTLSFLETITRNHDLAEYSLSVNRDGSWSKTVEYDFEDTYQDSEVTITDSGHRKQTYTGTWSFVNKTQGYENKERVTINVLASSSQNGDIYSETNYTDPSVPDYSTTIPAYTIEDTYQTGEEYMIYDIIRLKTREMKWEAVTGHSSGNFITEGFEKITWESN